MKRAIVTGGAGFIGSHLTEELTRRGYHVTILDDLSTGNIDNVRSLVEGKQVELIQGSITDLPLLQKLFRGVNYVFHLAAIPSVARSIDDPQSCHEVNATGTLRVLLAARDAGATKVVYSSSCAVYGDTQTLPIKETTPPIPLSPYAVSKLAGEYYCSVFDKVYSLPAVCLRYFNVYGPGQRQDSDYAAVIPRFIKHVSQGQPPVIFGDGKQTRDFVFVKDVVAANILAAESDARGVSNIGSGKSTTISKLARLIIKLLGSGVVPSHKEERPGDIKFSQSDISRATSFGFKPQYSLEKGLGETIKCLIP